MLFLSYKYDFIAKSKTDYNIYLVRTEHIVYRYVCFFLILLVGLRYRIGLDSINYEYNFDSVKVLSEISMDTLSNSDWDPLFYLFISLSKTICNQFFFFQILQAFFVNIIVFRFFWRNCNNHFSCLTFYYIFLYLSFSCETMRESCAVAMVLLGWEYLKKDKWILFSLFLIMAFGFHSSAIALFIIPLLKITKLWNLFKFNKLFIVLVILLILVGAYLSAYFWDNLLAVNISSRFDARAASYAEEQVSSSGLNIFGLVSKFFQFMLYPIIALASIKKYRPTLLFKNQEQMVILGLYIVSLSLNISILYRYQNYFLPFCFITIADFLYKFPVRINTYSCVKIHSYSGWLSFLFPAIFFWWLGMNQPVRGDVRYRFYMSYYPYSSVLFPTKDADREAVFRELDMFY